MTPEQRLERFSDLVVRTGANVQPGQDVPIVTKLEALQQAPDVAARPGGRERFEPCALLRALARDKRRFHDA